MNTGRPDLPTMANFPRGWTARGVHQHRAEVARSLAALAALTAARRDADGLRAELVRVRAELAELRSRALQRSVRLTELLHEESHLTGLLLADEAVADAPTTAIATRARKAG